MSGQTCAGGASRAGGGEKRRGLMDGVILAADGHFDGGCSGIDHA